MFNSKHIRTLERMIDDQNQSIIRMRNEFNTLARDYSKLEGALMSQDNKIMKLEKYLNISLRTTKATTDYVKIKE